MTTEKETTKPLRTPEETARLAASVVSVQTPEVVALVDAYVNEFGGMAVYVSDGCGGEMGGRKAWFVATVLADLAEATAKLAGAGLAIGIANKELEALRPFATLMVEWLAAKRAYCEERNFDASFARHGELYAIESRMLAAGEQR